MRLAYHGFFRPLVAPLKTQTSHQMPLFSKRSAFFDNGRSTAVKAAKMEHAEHKRKIPLKTCQAFFGVYGKNRGERNSQEGHLHSMQTHLLCDSPNP